MKIILTRGCSGSGKTTWAEKYIKDNKDKPTVNINRDDLREILFIDYKFSKKKEELITSIQYQMAENAIYLGYSIIVSDTNLNKKTTDRWEQFAKDNKLEVEYKDFVVDFEVLKQRNDKRGLKSVPISVLRDQYSRYMPKLYKFNQEAPKAILFDIDGTLADHNGRGAYDLENLKNDLPIQHVIDILNFYKQDHKIIIFSGREQGAQGQYKLATEMWLDKHSIHYDLLKMRLHSDRRPDYQVKDEMVRSISKDYNIILAVDDRQQVVDQYRLRGLKVLQVNYGDF